MMFKIQKGIEVWRGADKRYKRYPFGQMEVGDSFQAPKKEARRITSAAYMYGRKFGLKFATRSKKSIMRLWRIK